MERQTYLTLECALDSSVKRGYKFDLNSVYGEEGLCRDFSFNLKVSSQDRLTESEVDQLIGNQVTLKIGYLDKKGQVKYRLINGVVYQLTELGMSRRPLQPLFWRYEIEVGSWFKKLDYISDCRIIQKNGNTCTDIISDLLHEYGCRDFQFVNVKDLPRKDYTVIYNESPYNFIKRLAHEFGLLWRFEHKNSKHTLVFYKNSNQLPSLSEPLISSYRKTSTQSDSLLSFSKKERHFPVTESLFASYDWVNQPVKSVQNKSGSKKGKLTYFRYPAEFENRSDGKSLIRTFNAALKTESQEYVAESTIRSLTAGKLFNLQVPTLPDLTNKQYIIRDLKIEATETNYHNYFTAVSATNPFQIKEDKTIEFPKIVGPQTAIVVGESGKGEVSTTSLGEVRIRFHWDHHSQAGSSGSSAFVRVAMPAAGCLKGMQFVPRIAEEVVVYFENGNPEKPFIVGSVYSKNNPPPHAPNTQPYKSIIKNGADQHANQVVFDDKPGTENLDITAKKDMTIDVTNDFNIDAVNNINIKAKSIFIVDKGEVKVKAGGDIDNLSLATIINLALESETYTAGGNMMDLALGAVISKAGAAIANDAGVLLANTSVLGVNQSSEELVSSVSQALLLNTAPSIINTAGKSINSKSGLAIINSASENTFNDAKEKKDDIGLISTTETNGTMIKGKTSIGP